MRLLNNTLRKLKFFRVEERKSDYVGTEQKCVQTGCFPVQLEIKQSVSTDGRNGQEKYSDAKLYFPPDLPVKIGDGFCITGDIPQYRIISVAEYTDHCTAEAVLWK